MGLAQEMTRSWFSVCSQRESYLVDYKNAMTPYIGKKYDENEVRYSYFYGCFERYADSNNNAVSASDEDLKRVSAYEYFFIHLLNCFSNRLSVQATYLWLL